MMHAVNRISRRTLRQFISPKPEIKTAPTIMKFLNTKGLVDCMHSAFQRMAGIRLYHSFEPKGLGSPHYPLKPCRAEEQPEGIPEQNILLLLFVSIMSLLF
jgi:hypothetical protein